MDECYLKNELYHKVKSDDTIFDFIQQGSLDGLWYWDLITLENEWMSPKFWETLGYDPLSKKHHPREWYSIIHPDDLKLAQTNLQKHLDNPSYPYNQIVRYVHKNGSTVWIQCRGIAIRDTHGKAIRMLGAHTDITKYKEAENSLYQLKEEYETVFNGTQDAMFLIDVLGYQSFEFVRTNSAHQVKTGIPLEMIARQTPESLLGEPQCLHIIDNYQRCVDAKMPIKYEECLDLPAGKRIWHTTLTPVVKNNQVTQIVGSAIDVTKQKKLEKDLEYKANYDGLTQLVNRSYLYDKLEYLIKRQQPFTIYFIDLNDFKEINDTYGHLFGDLVLKHVAKNISEILDEHDFASRLGGDEFAYIKVGQKHLDIVHEFKEILFKSIEKPLLTDEKKLKMYASIGHACFPEDGLTTDELLQKSDQAMYEMKHHQKTNK